VSAAISLIAFLFGVWHPRERHSICTFFLGGVLAVNNPSHAGALIPDRPTLLALQIAASGCRACDLWKREVAACRPWLDVEIALVRPRAILCLGANAAQALLGRQFKVTARRGELMPSPLAPNLLATVHPSSILRVPDHDARQRELKRFTDEVRRLVRALSSKS
jgi:uracil-DNA glycosylase